MSQSKISKKSTTTGQEENGTEFKQPPVTPEPPHSNGTDNASVNIPDLTKNEIHTRSRSKTPVLNKTNVDDPKLSGSPSHSHNTRSRSKTPQNKAPLQDISNEISSDTIIEQPEESADTINTTASTEINLGETDLFTLEKEDEEVMPELEFDDTDVDVESEGSPDRCKTRRSQVTFVSTPKTPKNDECINVDLNDVPEYDNSDTHSSTSIDNISTTAVVGNDVINNVDFVQDSVFFDDNAYISPERNVSFREALRNISPRRTIRHLKTDNYRKFALENNHLKYNDSETETVNYDAVPRVTGVKRKSSSIQFNAPKKLKQSQSFLSYITLPIYNLKNSMITNSNAKTIEHRDNNSVLDCNDSKIEVEIEKEGHNRKWCSIM